MKKDADVLVLGGGPAGYIAAIQAKRLGASVVVVEQDELGGTCLNRGCIPTKYYLKTAELMEEIADAAKRGIRLGQPHATIDLGVAVKGKNSVVKKLTDGVGSLLRSNGITVIQGSAQAVGPSEAVLSTGGSLTCSSMILAGGSTSGSLPIEGIDNPKVSDSTALLDPQAVPGRLAIIGGGVIGIEMASIFRAFGSEVEIIELAPRLLPSMDADVSAVIETSRRKRGVRLHLGASVRKILDDGDGLLLQVSDGKSVACDRVLLSIGRHPDLSCIAPGLVATEKGRIVVDDRMETSLPGVFAPGDINGRKMLAHAAYHMGEIAAINAVAHARPDLVQYRCTVDLRFVPSAVYASPEVGSVGLTEEEAVKRGKPLLVGRFPLQANGRALAGGASEGFVKVVADAAYGELLGVHAVGQSASEIIQEAAVCMSQEITIHELKKIIHGHPTISEALMEAAADALGESLHLPPRN